jgi:hypothetical protein
MIPARPLRACRGDFPLYANSNEGILDLAVAEDKALLRSNLSAAAVQWHGDAAHVGRRSLAQIMLLAQRDKSQGFGDGVPKS